MKRLIIILGLMVIVLITSSCSALEKPQDRDLTPEPAVTKTEQPEILIPEVSSRDAELYVMQNEDGTSYVVNSYGTAAAEYRVDSDGNIIREDGTIAVKNGNTELYHETESLRFAEEEYRVSLDPLNLPVEYYYSGIYPNAAVPLRVSLEFDNADAANRVVLLESSNPQVISVCPNQNAGLIAHGAFQVPVGSVALQPDNPAEPMSITVSAKNAGDATLTARAFTGDAVAQCLIHVEFGEGNRSAVPEEWITSSRYNTAAHVHSYSPTVTAPTIWEEGYTLYVCNDCGHSYKGDYVPRLPAQESEPAEAHVHSYTESTVAPTASERGYTLYVCQGCGDSYKANFIEPTG